MLEQLVCGTCSPQLQAAVLYLAGHSLQPAALLLALIAADLLPQDTGAVLQSWGSDLFYMPHGLTVDPEGNIWVTDVGLQQALKFSPSGKLLQSLGQQLEPGSTEGQFCKPTHVSVGAGRPAALLKATLRAIKGMAVISWRAQVAGSLQGLSCLLLGVLASPHLQT